MAAVRVHDVHRVHEVQFRNFILEDTNYETRRASGPGLANGTRAVVSGFGQAEPLHFGTQALPADA